MVCKALETNSNYTLRHLQNISSYIITEYKVHYVSLKKKKLIKFKILSNNKYR